MSTKKSTTLEERFGDYPDESGLKKKMRLHQGWWRTNVLSEDANVYPNCEGRTLCSKIIDGENSGSNFLTENTRSIVRETLDERKAKKIKRLGVIEENRLFDNLLSSQPLCFNFFAELSMDTDFGLSVLKAFYPNLTKLRNVFFEFAPQENYTGDNSAFDVAFEVEIENKTGLIGLECKYTDSFSSKEYGKMEDDKSFGKYNDIYSNSNAFEGSYEELTHSGVNQLFRNQLIAESLKLNKKYSFVYTGLFCMQEDEGAIETATYFQSLLNPINTDFKIITYKDFITNIQKLELDWEKREWTMLLWARYCAIRLSESTIKQLQIK